MYYTKYDSEAKVWEGPEDYRSFFHPSISAGQAILHLLSIKPDRVNLISADDGSSLTNAQVYAAALKIAWNLRTRGCAKGDVVVFIMRNSLYVTSAILGSLYIGAPISGLDPAFSKKELLHSFTMTKPKFVFCDDTEVNLIQDVILELGTDTQIIVVGKKIPELLHLDDFLLGDLKDDGIQKLIFHPPRVSEADVSAIVCTSGTTGFSKGIIMSHEVYLTTFNVPRIVDFINEGDAFMSYSTAYWCTFHIALLSGALKGGVRIITRDPFTPSGFLKIAKQYNLSYFMSTPIHAGLLLKHPDFQPNCLPNLKYYGCMGSALSHALATDLQQHLPSAKIANFYGMNEVGSITTHVFDPAITALGVLTEGVTAMILDEDGQRMDVGEQGEICVKTISQFTGYCGNPDAMKEVIDDDGWVHTGDVGFFDQDGYLHYVERKKESIKYKLYHVAPGDVEQVIEKHPAVFQVALVGIPDPLCIDLPAAAVVKKDGCHVTEQEIIELVDSNVMDAMRLRGGVFFMDNLPMTPSGKVKKNVIRNRVTELYNERKTTRN
ncbi:uncharacterized protein LOC132255990 [Phlebotomus argentipes]|uniref:uncharacterized protein LOC132255990 n=1 Tax=Phlebotomus argentipes TaxID=94469 RepID=UPI00289365E6|nr:uncharacterized protein LOC132255990 [Phlebotomus argentipes]